MTEIKSYLKTLLEIHESNFDYNDQRTLITKSNLATAYRRLGKSKISESLFLNIMNKRLKILSKERLLTAATATSLATILLIRG
jgi:hypothetical protein